MFTQFSANNNVFAQNTQEFAQLFTAHTQKFFAAQQSFAQAQLSQAQAQWTKVSAAKNPAEALELLSQGFVPAAQDAVKQAQAVWNLSLEARNDISAKQKALVEVIGTEGKAALDKALASLPNQGEPVVGYLKAATTAANGALEQVSKHLVDAQTAFEANVAKAFDQAASSIPAAANQVQAAVATVSKAAAKK